MDAPSPILLEVKSLSVERSAGLGERGIGLRRVSLSLASGEIMVLAGETGSGKSLLARLIPGAAGPQTKVLGGSILFEGRDLLKLKPRELREIRRSGIAMVTGDGAGQWNPDRTVRQWLRDCIRMAKRSGVPGGEKGWSDFFYSVGIIEPERVLPMLMGDLSLNLAKRLLVMRALLSRARLLVCDDATSDLDRIAEIQFIELLTRVREEHGIGILMTSGSLRGIDRYADRAAIFYEGGILEAGTPSQLLNRPRYAYTREFRSCDPGISDLPRELPTISRKAAREAEEAIHEASSSLEEGATG
jgi:ABC-type glutathione transport system ATPase component